MAFTSVEQCIIKPHHRYIPRIDYPNRVIVCHHKSYLTLLRELSVDNPNEYAIDTSWKDAREFRLKFWHKGKPFVLDNSRDNAEETVTHVIEHYFWGGRNIINVSSAGAISQELSIGDTFIATHAIPDNRVTHFFRNSNEIVESSPELTNWLRATTPSSHKPENEGMNWSTGTMYYT